MRKSKRVFIAGHNGMVGSAILKLIDNSSTEVITRSSKDLDLRNQQMVEDFFNYEAIDEVFLAAAKVGGIYANSTFSGEFIYENLMIQSNVIHQSFKSGVHKLLFLGSSCIYPKHANQPISEHELLTGMLESTNEPYAIAKIAGIKLCESYNRQYGVDYRSVMPTNLYGQKDNFHSENSHVIPAMMRRFHEAKLNAAKEVVVWGSGKPMREFLHVDDMASACIHVMDLDSEIYKRHTEPMLSHINVGTGKDCSIKFLAETLKKVIGLEADLVFDTSKPDGTARKLLDVSRIKELGWNADITLESGLKKTYEWFLDNQESYRH